MTLPSESHLYDEQRLAKLERVIDFLAECYQANWDLENHDISDVLALDFDAVRNRKE
jgi:hypothetical protein